MNIVFDTCKVLITRKDDVLTNLTIVNDDPIFIDINREFNLFLELKNKFTAKLSKNDNIFINKFYEEKISIMNDTHLTTIANLNKEHSEALNNLNKYNELQLSKLQSEFDLKLKLAEKTVESKSIKKVDEDRQQFEYSQIYNLITTKLNTGGAIGALGENIIKSYYDEFAKFNNDIVVSNTSGIKEHGDLMINYKSLNISVEIKNYKSVIPVKEIDKFYKSISKQDYNAGIFISLNTTFNSKSNIKPIDFIIKNNKPVIFLSNINSDNKLVLLLSLELLQIYYNSIESQAMTTTEYINFIKDQLIDLNDMITDLDKQKQLISKHETRIMKMKNNMLKVLNSVSN